MSKSKDDLTSKFFHPPQRTVSCHNGLLDTRTKHIVAKDRLLVAHQRILDVERRKSASNLQFLAFEQKKFEKKVSSRFGSDHLFQQRQRSTSDASDRPMTYWHGTSDTKLNESLNSSNSNVLYPPKFDKTHPRFSLCSEDDLSENHIFSDDEQQNDSLKLKKKKSIQAPAVAVIPPDEDV